MNEPQLISTMRNRKWSEMPTSSGVYWWYFPRTAFESFRISEFCDITKLHLRSTPDNKICLYHGLANNLAQRVKWHAAKKLRPVYIQTGFLSTFRFTLLALNNFDYLEGEEKINNYFDQLSISWRPTATREEAEIIERNELHGTYHYPLNIQANRKPELLLYLKYLKATRSAYKKRYSN